MNLVLLTGLLLLIGCICLDAIPMNNDVMRIASLISEQESIDTSLSQKRTREEDLAPNESESKKRSRISNSSLNRMNDVTSLASLRASALNGSKVAQLQLGLHYYHGNGVAVDSDEAKKWFRKAANQGCLQALSYLGYCNTLETDSINDQTISFRRNMEDAKKGDPFALNNLGYHYEHGFVVQKDLVKSFHLYQQSANLECAAGLFNVGLCYKDGKGIPKNEVKAIEAFSKSAELGFSKAQNMLGTIYENGWYLPKNLELAFHWYLKAAESGDADAQHNVAQFYNSGIHVQRNVIEAAIWYKKAADQGDKFAKQDLQLLEEEILKINTKSSSSNSQFIVNLSQQRPSNLTAEAQYHWALQCLDGLDIPRNEPMGFHYLQMAAEQGYAPAQNHLGICYEKGIGIDKNMKLAFDWYVKAAEKNCIGALYNVGRCYVFGLHVEKDEYEAIKWYKKAADLGHKKSLIQLQIVEFRLKNNYNPVLKATDSFQMNSKEFCPSQMPLRRQMQKDVSLQNECLRKTMTNFGETSVPISYVNLSYLIPIPLVGPLGHAVKTLASRSPIQKSCPQPLILGEVVQTIFTDYGAATYKSENVQDILVTISNDDAVHFHIRCACESLTSLDASCQDRKLMILLRRKCVNDIQGHRIVFGRISTWKAMLLDISWLNGSCSIGDVTASNVFGQLRIIVRRSSL